MNRELFTTLWEVQVLVERWRQHYNQVRPHWALGFRPPAHETRILQSAQMTFNLVQPRGAGHKGDADTFRDKVGPEARQRLTPMVPATITLQKYAEHWTRLISHTVKPRTLDRYAETLTLHILPRFEKVRV